MTRNAPIEIIAGLSYSSRAELFGFAALFGVSACSSWVAKETTLLKGVLIAAATPVLRRDNPALTPSGGSQMNKTHHTHSHRVLAGLLISLALSLIAWLFGRR